MTQHHDQPITSLISQLEQEDANYSKALREDENFSVLKAIREKIKALIALIKEAEAETLNA